MSWDIILFNTKQKIDSIEEVDESQLEPIDFSQILEGSFSEIVKDDNHREIKEKDFSIDFFTDEELVSNKMISLYGENGLFELIELAKKYGWQIFDTGLNEMIDLDDPGKNGYENHRKYVEQIMKNR
ncbi:MAG: hypothetical protein OEW75_02635 [Cyclobacteriaceae bacterium]|nr:hypothetical protein [Cyclobacteriaceae bacterium]